MPSHACKTDVVGDVGQIMSDEKPLSAILVDFRCDPIHEDVVTKTRPKIIVEEHLFNEIVEAARKDQFEEFPDISKSVEIEFDKFLIDRTRKVGSVDVIYRYEFEDKSGFVVGVYPAYVKFGKIFVVLDIVELEQERNRHFRVLLHDLRACTPFLRRCTVFVLSEGRWLFHKNRGRKPTTLVVGGIPH